MLQNTKKYILGSHTRPLKSISAPLHESQIFYWSIMTADDSIKCRCANSGMTGKVGGFQNPGLCLQAFPSFLPHPLSAFLLTPFFSRCLTLVTRSLLLNRTETLATRANFSLPAIFLLLAGFHRSSALTTESLTQATVKLVLTNFS